VVWTYTLNLIRISKCSGLVVANRCLGLGLVKILAWDSIHVPCLLRHVVATALGISVRRRWRIVPREIRLALAIGSSHSIADIYHLSHELHVPQELYFLRIGRILKRDEPVPFRLSSLAVYYQSYRNYFPPIREKVGKRSFVGLPRNSPYEYLAGRVTVNGRCIEVSTVHSQENINSSCTFLQVN